LAGAVRTYKLLSDGRRQIGAFHLVGDIFYVNGATNRFSTETIVKTNLRLINQQGPDTESKEDSLAVPTLLNVTSNVTSNDLEHAEKHLHLLGRKNALERVAEFLLEMDNGLTGAGVMTLPMSHCDIGDYLGLSLETVSRALSLDAPRPRSRF
jgi:CRP/FNR family transcriptional regulator, nitrogen fixation regulation protein